MTCLHRQQGWTGFTVWVFDIRGTDSEPGLHLGKVGAGLMPGSQEGSEQSPLQLAFANGF